MKTETEKQVNRKAQKTRRGMCAQNKGQVSMDGAGPPSDRHKEWKQDPHHDMTITKFPNTSNNKGLKDYAKESVGYQQRKGFGHLDFRLELGILSSVFKILQENYF